VLQHYGVHCPDMVEEVFPLVANDFVLVAVVSDFRPRNRAAHSSAFCRQIKEGIQEQTETVSQYGFIQDEFW